MATPVSVAFHTLGCKLNFSETSTIRRQFEAAGYDIRSFENGADICVINTCSVTDFADRKCRKVVRQALRNNRECKIVVIGCYAQLKPHEVSEIDGVDLVLGAAEKFNLLNYIDRLDKTPGKGWVNAGDISSHNSFSASFSYGDRTRSFLKIQDGCDYNCSFCTIPQARGSSKSDSIQHVIANARTIAAEGIREIVLTGVNIGDFRDPKSDKMESRQQGRLIHLLDELEKIDSVERFRISSIEPNLCSNETIDMVAASRKFMPHFHMPLQSGNDHILRLMRRRYTRDLYRDRVAYIRSRLPDACIGADVIVGFPGESDNDFDVTRTFLRDLDINYLHVFTYSERSNTAAANMPDSVPMGLRRERNEQLRQLSNQKQRQFYQENMQSWRAVLLEKSKKSGFLSGFTDNYIKIEIPKTPGLEVNRVCPLYLNQLMDDGLVRATADDKILTLVR